MSVGESVVRGALANFSSQPITWAASLLAAAAVPRFLGSDALGQLTIAFSITTLATPALDLGIFDYLTRRVAQNPSTLKHDVGVALMLQTAVFLLGALTIGFVLPLVAPSLVDFRLLYLALIGLVGAPAQRMLASAMRGQEHHVRFAWLGATTWLASTIGAIPLLFLGADVLTFTAATVGLTLVATLFNWMVAGLRVSLPAINRTFVRDAREFIRGGFPFLSWNITLSVYGGVDKLLLGALVPVSQVGWYSAAYSIIGITAFVPTVLTIPLFPALSRTAHEPDTLRRALAHTIRVALLLTVPLSAGILVVAQAVPNLLGWPADFANAVPLMMILSIHLPIVAIDMLLGTVIMAIRRERKWVWVGISAAVFNVLVNLMCIPLFEHLTGNGAIGASIVTVLTEILMFFGALALLPKDLLDRTLVWQAARIVLAGLGTAAVGLLLLPVALPAAVAGGAIAYVSLILLLRVLTPEDARYLTKRFGWRRA